MLGFNLMRFRYILDWERGREMVMESCFQTTFPLDYANRRRKISKKLHNKTNSNTTHHEPSAPTRIYPQSSHIHRSACRSLLEFRRRIDTRLEPAHGGGRRRGGDVQPFHFVALGYFRIAESAAVQPQLPFLGKHFFRWLRIVPVSFHRFCRQRTPSGRSRHGQLSLADVYHHRCGLV